jgi:hypothetical protein
MSTGSRSGTARTSPSVTVPRRGVPISVTEDLSYVKRASALLQAEMWNEVLLDDPIFSNTGMVVGVGPRMDGRYPLVWVASGTGGGDEAPSL